MIPANVVSTLRASPSSSADSTTTSGSSSIRATRYGSVAGNSSIPARSPPPTRMRSGPSGTLSLRATGPAPQHPVAGRRPCLLADHARADLDAAPERPVLDLDLLIEPALRVLRAALALDDQLAAADLERHAVEIHAGDVRLDDRPRGLAA